jgi:dTDP-4-amino-4,6-dideoxygalactose transaminase
LDNPVAALAPADPKANYLAHRSEIDAAIGRVLESGWYIGGQEVAAFEQEFAAWHGVTHAIGVGSGTEAVHLALRACGVQTGDWVVTVAHTAVATVAAIELAGARPVLCDIDPRTYNVDLERLHQTVRNLVDQPQQGTLRAIVIVHLYGHPAPLAAVRELADRYGLALIEDCAQAHGAMADGHKVGTVGRAAAFSFYPTKNLGALGDGGCVITADPEVAQRCRLLREYGWEERYISKVVGTNSRLDAMQAAILRVKLKHLEVENGRRRALAAIYDRQLAPLQASGVGGLALPDVQPNVRHVYHQYVVRLADRDQVRQTLAAAGISTLILYPVPIHLQPAYCGRVRLGVGGLGQTEMVCHQILSLPIHPQLSDAQLLMVAAQVRDAVARTNG